MRRNSTAFVFCDGVISLSTVSFLQAHAWCSTCRDLLAFEGWSFMVAGRLAVDTRAAFSAQPCDDGRGHAAQVPLRDLAFNSVGCAPRIGTAGSHGSPIFNFLRSGHAVSHSSCAI